MEKVHAGMDALGEFAPQFAHLNDDVLFGQVWSREQYLPARERSMITVTALMASGILDNSLRFHMQKAKENKVTKTEMVEVLTQAAFYAGWPKAWAAFQMAKEVYEAEDKERPSQESGPKDGLFPRGEKNEAFAPYFIGQSYLYMISKEQISIAHVTFEPGCRNNWHIHHKGGQILLVTQGSGWYQEWGKKPQYLQPGDVVNIPPEVKHWHGASKDCWFAHLAIEVPTRDGSNEWLEALEESFYQSLK